MLAAKLFGPGDVRVVECDVPAITSDEMLLRVEAAAICGTDLRMVANGWKGVDERHPLTLGHEVSGTIVQVGQNVQGYAPGMRVAVAPNMGCGICDACVRGDTHLCTQYQAFGINRDGGFAEYLCVPGAAIAQGNVMVLGTETPFATAALFEPMSCVLNGQQRAGVRLNDTVLVIGAGPIGVMHALLAQASGAARVLISDLSAARRQQCLALVPGAAALPGNNLLEEVMQETKGRGVDVCITACPSAAAQAQAPSLMAMNGRILYFGGLPTGRDEVCLATNFIHYRQLSICGSTRANVAQFRAVAKMEAAGNLKLGALVSKCFALADFSTALAYASSAAGLKTVIVPPIS
ncbi:MAG: alcohol dehydrogenase catalytic domain-containing protein [Gemmiger sp.]|nr:alcohol dehydrogenase catalytic domain-containing protein [Gemmiger sp.]